MSATFTITRRNLSIALTVTLPAAAMCLAAGGAGSLRSASSQPMPSYHAPTIAIAQPGAGGAVPQDRPVVLFRFAAGEATDPIDVASFAVSLDGNDRTAGFHLSATEGWGSLSGIAGDDLLPIGSHTIDARICSVRGACAVTSTAIVVQRGPVRRAR